MSCFEPPAELIEDWIELSKPRPGSPPNPNKLAALASEWGREQATDLYDSVLSLRAEKEKIANEVAKLAKEFTSTTGIRISSFNLHYWDTFGGFTAYTAEVEINL